MQKQQLMQFPLHNMSAPTAPTKRRGSNRVNVWFENQLPCWFPLCGCIGWDEIHNMFAPLFKSNLHLQPWRVTSYESLSLSEPQSVPKATSLSLAITPDEQGTPCTLLMSGLGGLERRHLHKENNDTGAAAIGKVPFNSTGIKINFGTFLLP